MLKAVRSGVVSFRDHLSNCPDCRELFSMLSRYACAGSEPLVSSSPRHLKCLEKIAHRMPSWSPSKVIQGFLKVDSWAHIPALQLRDAAGGLERRLHLEAGAYTLELVAEQQRESWAFVARVYNEGEVSQDFVLKAGAQKILAEDDGFYHWSSPGTPHTLKLISEAFRIDFQKVSWLTTTTN